MPSSRTAKLTDVADADTNGDAPALPAGSTRAAKRRLERARERGETVDPMAQAQAQYQQLAVAHDAALRDKAVAQQAAYYADTLLEAAKAQLDQALDYNRQLAGDVAALTAELDAIYDANPELVPEDRAAVAP